MTTASSIRTEDKCDRLARYLRREVDGGECYVKSKFIAGDVGLSSKEVGTLLPRVARDAPDLEIEQWGYSNATTWRVRAVDATTGDE